MKNMSKVLALIMVLVLAVANLSAYAAEAKVIQLQIGNQMMTVDGAQQPIDEEGTVPVIQNNRTLMPIRAIVEAMDGSVLWDEATNTATLTHTGQTIQLTIGSETATLNGNPQTLDVAPIIINGRTMLPIRFIVESFGYSVDWDAADERITITENENNKANLQSNVLIVYYSVTGNTQKVAKMIEQKTGADIYLIEPEISYSTDHDETMVEMAEERESGNIRELKGVLPDLSVYDTILIGSPVWGRQPSNPVQKYLSLTDFGGKKVAGFWTAHVNPGTYAETFKSMVKNGQVLDGLSLLEADAPDFGMNEWLKALGISVSGKDEPAEQPENKAVSALDLYNEFKQDVQRVSNKYSGASTEVTGVVAYTGPDPHGTPSIALSNTKDGKQYVLFVVNSFDQLNEVSVGDTVAMKGNFHIFGSDDWVVLKQGVIISK